MAANQTLKTRHLGPLLGLLVGDLEQFSISRPECAVFDLRFCKFQIAASPLRWAMSFSRNPLKLHFYGNNYTWGRTDLGRCTTGPRQFCTEMTTFWTRFQ